MKTTLITIGLTLILVIADFLIKKATLVKGNYSVLLMVIAVILYGLSPIGWYWVMTKYKLLSIGAIYSVLTVVLLTIIGLVFFNEKVSVREVIGLCLAVVSLILLTTKQ